MALYGQCRAGAQINFPESGRGLGHVTATILAVRSAILATAWLLVSKDDTIRFWSKIYDNWKVTLLPIYLENSEPKTGQEHKFW